MSEAGAGMDLTTRCPRCNTVFQVGLQDLQLRKGYIRCVQCAHIFDGYAAVVSESEPTSLDTAPAAITPTVPDLPPHAASSTAPRVFRSSRESAEPRFTFGGPGRGPDTGVQGEDATQRPGADPIPSIIVEPHPARASYQGGSAAPLLREDSVGVFELLGRWLVGVLVLLGVVLLLAQITYVYRAQIALTLPALRPVLVRACVPLHCQIPYARDPAQLAITGSDLKLDASIRDTDAGAAARHFVLHISLRNRADQPQEWPSIVLDLNDASGARLVRRNLSPREYLTPQLLAGPFAPNSEVQVQVPITLNDIQINGYQLGLFFS